MIDVNVRGTVPAAEVVAAETALGASFPEPFRSWVQATGGGYVRPEIPMPIPDGEAILDEFMDPSSIADNYGQGFAVSVPRRYVVVAGGPGGGVALRLYGEGRGRVYFADYDKAIQLYDDGVLEDEDDQTEEIMTELAPDWKAFLASR